VRRPALLRCVAVAEDGDLEPNQLLLLPLWYVVFLLSITCHEGAHAWAAYRGGDLTAYHAGQVSLNPLPHIQREMFGTVIVPLATYVYMGWMMGWASAPYDPHWEARHPRRAAWMALAGPGSNLGLALLGLGALKLGLLVGVWTPFLGEYYEIDRVVSAVGLWEGIGRFCSILFGLNLVLFLFNLIPLPPMDGASVLSGFVAPAREWYEKLRSVPMASLGGLLIAWMVFPRVFWALYPPLVHWLWR
jgi:Zn-dependent protease